MPYRALQDLQDELNELGATVVGESHEGRPLHAIDVGTGPERVVVLAGIHAMEWIGVEVGLALLRKLRERPPEGATVRFFPCVNPDGYAKVERDRDARRFVRTNARGVDLNRNWPVHWRASHWRAALFPFLGHGGRAPRSENEVDTVCQSLDDWGPVARALSLHSFGRKVLFPYGGVWRRPDDRGAQARVARILADSVTGYEAVQSSRWVPGAFAYGMELDTLHAEYGATAILVECSAGGFTLRDPATWTRPFRWFNPADPMPTVRALTPPLASFVRGEIP